MLSREPERQPDRIVIATLGSLGDLLPLLAVARELVRSGNSVTIAANPIYRTEIEFRGLGFAPLGIAHDPMDVPASESGSDILDFIDHVNFSQLDRLLDDLCATCAGAAAILAPYFVVPAHLAGEKFGIPFLACAFSPAHILKDSTHFRVPFRWHSELARLRSRAGLPRKLLPYSAVFNAPEVLLGLFPQFLLPADSRVPAAFEFAGYPHAVASRPGPDDELALRFCDDRTVIFSFGTHVDRRNAAFWFTEAVAACRQLRLKCLYLSKFVDDLENRDGASDVLVRRFVDHAALFPKGAVVVHHAGIGTTMAACRSARPMVTVPFLYDQPFNACRLNEVFEVPCVSAHEYNRSTLESAIVQALERDDSTREAIMKRMALEPDGALGAGSAISRCMASNR